MVGVRIEIVAIGAFQQPDKQARLRAHGAAIDPDRAIEARTIEPGDRIARRASKLIADRRADGPGDVAPGDQRNGEWRERQTDGQPDKNGGGGADKRGRSPPPPFRTIRPIGVESRDQPRSPAAPPLLVVAALSVPFWPAALALVELFWLLMALLSVFELALPVV
jgi:hypothetical protein